MKVLIVDDEEHVREAIMLMVDWESFGVKEVLFGKDGAEALKLIARHEPAVLICDMNMPGVDGAELLHTLREQDGDTQVIVASGYDHFAYTRAALLAKGIDYLLKPLRKRDLELALEQAITAWQTRRSHLEKEIETGFKLRMADALMDEHKLAGYFKGETAFSEDIRRVFARRGLPLERVRTALILPCNRAQVFMRFKGDMELFVFSLNNIAHEILRHYGAHYFCRLDEYQWLLLTAADASYAGSPHGYYIDKVMAAWEATLGLKVLTGLNQGETGIEGLPQAIIGARAALLDRDLFQERSIDNKEQAAPLRLKDQQLMFEVALKKKEKRAAAGAVQAFAARLRERGRLRLKELQGYTLEANAMLEKLGGTAMPELQAENKLMPQWIGDFEEWERLLIKLWEDMIEEQDDVRGGRGIDDVYNYITDHFQEDISLTTLAEKFSFNPHYISRKFKEMYNTSVITYLTALRMSKAKMLLAHTTMNVSELANMLGYADENYFSKVFKKQLGVSPLQYRKEQAGK
ncbi:response regulator [Paenibacillus sp. GCM10012307]|uniref:Response regulator n=1 Tax=Paenibacillus roseus TaxID=2798579 RepID=A0A934MN48_9BACL|nr:response regulator [Paenibacillus roseus]MBJ6360626.1 response regulator [Paenibacillus roseus]